MKIDMHAISAETNTSDALKACFLILRAAPILQEKMRYGCRNLDAATILHICQKLNLFEHPLDKPTHFLILRPK